MNDLPILRVRRSRHVRHCLDVDVDIVRNVERQTLRLDVGYDI